MSTHKTETNFLKYIKVTGKERAKRIAEHEFFQWLLNYKLFLYWTIIVDVKEDLVGGGKYLGEWKDGKQHGQGSYTRANGTVTEGLWEGGVKRDFIE